MKKISIIIPIYNVARYLPECLDSILTQTEPYWEAILVDDGSTDDSSSICDAYAQKDSRFRVIHQENAGAANAKNTGLDAARGNYIAFVDSDDTVDSKWLEISLAAIKDADVVEYGFDLHLPGRYAPTELLPASEFTAEEYLNQYIDHWQCSLFWNKLFRAELLNSVRFRKERRCIDDEFFTYKVMTNATRTIRIPDILYHYRQRQSSAVSSEKNALQRTKDALAIRHERYTWISLHFSNLRQKYLSRDLESMCYFAQSFPFDTDAIKEFRFLIRFYLKQCVLCPSSFLTFRLALRLLFLSDKKLLHKPSTKTQIPGGDFFA